MINPEHNGIHCMINSGVPLTPAICDVLMYNAIDMIEERRSQQRIKGRQYDGIITSNLEWVEHPGGFPIVTFNALIGVGQWDAGDVSFFVRPDHLDALRMNQGEWSRIMAHVIGLPPGLNPMEALAAIRRGEGIPMPMHMIPPEIMEQIMMDMSMDDDDYDDEPEWDTGSPTGGYGD